MKSTYQWLALLPLFPTFCSAAPTADTISICSALYEKYQEQLVWDPLGAHGLQTAPNATLYQTTSVDYWNLHNHDNRAACVFYPSGAQDVSTAVKLLNNYTSVDFSMKSGGHNANLGFSSSNGGVLISFRPNMKSTQISGDRLTADVEPGSRWDEAITFLDPYGKAIVGGRLGHVGVGGYMLGGGLSFLSSQYGFAADTVVNYELVLANGTITNANSTHNPSLFWALKGGGNAFAIVTKFTMKTFPMGQVWGGIRTYTADKHTALLAAVANFTETYPDPKAAIIPTFNFGGVADVVGICLVFYFYDGATAPAGIFDAFDAIDAFEDTTKTQSYPDLLTANNAESITGTFRYQIRETTFPQLPVANMSAFLDQHWEMMERYTLGTSLQSLDFQVFSFAVQPIPVALVEASRAMGGNAMGMAPGQGDRIFMEYDLSWANPIYDTVCPQYLRTVTEEIKDYHQQTYYGVAPTKYQNGSGDIDFISYNPIFMNDAMYDQTVLQSYGHENYRRLKSIAKDVDPDGFLATRQGGFKFDT